MNNSKSNLILKRIGLIPLLLLFSLFVNCSEEEIISVGDAEKAAQTLPEKFSTKATAGIGNGVNLQPSYYNSGNVEIGWDLMGNYSGIQSVRIEIEPDRVTQGARWISEAHAHGYQVIATYHEADQLGEDNTSYLNAAATWWVQNYATLSASGSITVNLMNEWGSHDISTSAFASAYNSAISTVRQVYSGMIIIDIPGYGQETHTAADAVNSISDSNIALSTHIYPSAYNVKQNHWLTNADLDYLGNAGVPCLVGEFGSGNTGDANWSALVDHAKSKGWTIMGWAWNGDGGDMNMASPKWADNANATSYTASSYMSTIIDKLGGGSSGGGSGGTGGGTGGGDTGSGNISVRAKGVVGDEQMQVQVNGSTVGTFTLSTSYQNYSVSGSGTVRVEFTNDQGDRDIQVDYITVDGTTFQAEDQQTNTAVWQDGSCGGSYSEWMHCGGYIEFGSNTTPPDPDPDPVPDPDPTPTGDCGGLPTWNASTAYTAAGTEVVYNGVRYSNNWYTQNQNPEQNSGQWQVWNNLGSCN